VTEMFDELPKGTKVNVLNEDGRVLFAGTVADIRPPFMFWHRVIPDGPIDLPPKYRIVSREVTDGAEDD
jgi:hypothetical protein